MFLLVQKGIYSYVVADYDCCVVGVHLHLDGYQSSGRRYMSMHVLIVFMSVLICLYREDRCLRIINRLQILFSSG